MNGTELEEYRASRRRAERIVCPANRLSGTERRYLSASGRFLLETASYQENMHGWSYSRGLVTRVADSGEVVEIKRNLGHFPHAFVLHPNGHEYLICGEHFEGYSIVDLTAAQIASYYPSEPPRLCISEAYPSPDGLVLATEGTYQATGAELRLLDFRRPEVLPLPVLAVVEGIDQVLGWVDAETVEYAREVPYRQADGVPTADLSQTEQEALEAEPGLVGYRLVTERLSRPAVE